MKEKPKPRIRVTAEALKKSQERKKKRDVDMRRIEHDLDFIANSCQVVSATLHIDGHFCFPIYKEDIESINEIWLFSIDRIHFAKQVNAFYRKKWQRAAFDHAKEVLLKGKWIDETLKEVDEAPKRVSELMGKAIREVGERIIADSAKKIDVIGTQFQPNKGDLIEYRPNGGTEWQRGYYLYKMAGGHHHVSEDADLSNPVTTKRIRKPRKRKEWVPVKGEKVSFLSTDLNFYAWRDGFFIKTTRHGRHRVMYDGVEYSVQAIKKFVKHPVRTDSVPTSKPVDQWQPKPGEMVKLLMASRWIKAIVSSDGLDSNLEKYYVVNFAVADVLTPWAARLKDLKKL